MTEDYAIVYTEKPEWAAIGQALTEYNVQRAGDDSAQTMCFVIRTPEQEIAGGVIGATYWNWLHIDLMWVRDDLRERGYGRRLLELAEQEARKRGAKHAYLDTFSFQAPDFYAHLGYQVFGELPDFPPGHRRFFMTKAL